MLQLELKVRDNADFNFCIQSGYPRCALFPSNKSRGQTCARKGVPTDRPAGSEGGALAATQRLQPEAISPLGEGAVIHARAHESYARAKGHIDTTSSLCDTCSAIYRTRHHLRLSSTAMLYIGQIQTLVYFPVSTLGTVSIGKKYILNHAGFARECYSLKIASDNHFLFPFTLLCLASFPRVGTLFSATRQKKIPV